jgi:uncharacterized membrane protein YraQ (UPF0718 family)/copper chaperone CopZ
MGTAFINEMWQIIVELAPPLLLGLLLAGLLHVFLPRAWIRQKLNAPTLGSVLRAVLIGIPLPLCSCGVVPTAIGLKQQGASRGAATGFLISTPQTGVDSILVSATFLGWPFAIFKLAAAFVTGLIGGAAVNRWEARTLSPNNEQELASVPRRSVLEVFRYAVFDLLALIDIWLAVGVVLAALLGVVLPPDFFAQHDWTRGILGMLVVLAVALPLYVCTTSSVPIAASLIAAGMPLGTALVFLMAGPATNIATLGAVWRGLGARVLATYLATVVVMSIGFGLAFDFVLANAATPDTRHYHGIDALGVTSAVILIALIVLLLARRLARLVRRPAEPDAEHGMDLTIKVEGMTCKHCVANVKRAVERVADVDEALPDLDSGRVRVRGDGLDVEAIQTAIESAGYKASMPP